MSSIWVRRISRTVLAVACGFAFALASGCCKHCHKPCCAKDKDKDMTSTTTKTEQHK